MPKSRKENKKPKPRKEIERANSVTDDLNSVIDNLEKYRTLAKQHRRLLRELALPTTMILGGLVTSYFVIHYIDLFLNNVELIHNLRIFDSDRGKIEEQYGVPYYQYVGFRVFESKMTKTYDPANYEFITKLISRVYHCVHGEIPQTIPTKIHVQAKVIEDLYKQCLDSHEPLTSLLSPFDELGPLGALLLMHTFCHAANLLFEMKVLHPIVSYFLPNIARHNQYLGYKNEIKEDFEKLNNTKQKNAIDELAKYNKNYEILAQQNIRNARITLFIFTLFTLLLYLSDHELTLFFFIITLNAASIGIINFAQDAWEGYKEKVESSKKKVFEEQLRNAESSIKSALKLFPPEMLEFERHAGKTIETSYFLIKLSKNLKIKNDENTVINLFLPPSEVAGKIKSSLFKNGIESSSINLQTLRIYANFELNKKFDEMAQALTQKLLMKRKTRMIEKTISQFLNESNTKFTLVKNKDKKTDPTVTFLFFENESHQAIKKLKEILGDKASYGIFNGQLEVSININKIELLELLKLHSKENIVSDLTIPSFPVTQEEFLPESTNRQKKEKREKQKPANIRTEEENYQSRIEWNEDDEDETEAVYEKEVLPATNNEKEKKEIPKEPVALQGEIPENKFFVKHCLGESHYDVHIANLYLQPTYKKRWVIYTDHQKGEMTVKGRLIGKEVGNFRLFGTFKQQGNIFVAEIKEIKTHAEARRRKKK